MNATNRLSLRIPVRLGAAFCLVLALAACGNTQRRLAEVGQEPKLTRVVDPTAVPGYQPVVMPMPAPQPMERSANSLWRSGSRAFLKDQRAGRVGDILTVLIRIDDKAQLQNKTTRTRNNTESAGIPSFLGLESKLGKILPKAVDPSSLIDMSSDTSNSGSGAVTRGEAINLKVAALVTQVLPNGNMALQGRQEVRVNFEVRELLIAGVVRPEDITSENTISYEKIAEARIAYGGRGQLSDVQQPRYGQQIYDIVFPF
ncbi:flagellar L-ring protein precursor FlgH [Constrictibacter sp. MBR-5]|jgi:flagellar L-ring protein precursor FlgH|uniref:flagellar basal body L-ring protein FlgH n=1 Tax=Constrictibacter sp. MBR-5 TaxID=3156467 RepID=UPI003395661D